MSTAAASGTAAVQSGRKPRSKPSPSAPSSSLPEPLLADVPLAQEPPLQEEPPLVKAYLARKPLVIQGTTYKPGDEIPFAHEILRIEGWVRAGYLTEVWR